MTCDLCGRVGDRGFRGLPGVALTLLGETLTCPAMIVCKAATACRKRQLQRARATR